MFSRYCKGTKSKHSCHTLSEFCFCGSTDWNQCLLDPKPCSVFLHGDQVATVLCCQDSWSGNIPSGLAQLYSILSQQSFPRPVVSQQGKAVSQRLVLSLLSGGRQHGCTPQPILCYRACAAPTAGDHWRLVLYGAGAAYPVLQVHPFQAHPNHLLPRWGPWGPAPPGMVPSSCCSQRATFSELVVLGEAVDHNWGAD